MKDRKTKKKKSLSIKERDYLGTLGVDGEQHSIVVTMETECDDADWFIRLRTGISGGLL